MKLKTKEDVDLLDSKIKEELGVELKKYVNKEAVTSFIELLVFPLYAFFWVSIPMIGFLMLFFSGYWLFTLTSIGIVFYSTFGLFFIALFAISFSFMFVIYKTKKDLLTIFTYSFDVMQRVIVDAKHLDGRVAIDEQKAARKILFQGVIHLVTIPTITKVITEKIPLIGAFFSEIIHHFLRLMTTRLDFEKKINLQPDEKSSKDFVNASVERIEFAKKTIEVILLSTFWVVGTPLILISVISFGCFILVFLAV